MAAAVGVPTLAYFGTRNPSPWTAPDAGPHQALCTPRPEAPPPRAGVEIVAALPEAAAGAAARLLAETRA
jgi:hypothetical protein